MPEGATGTEMGALALLFGGAACVGCLAGVGFLASAVFGISLAPLTVLEGAWGYALSGVFLLGFGVLAVRQHRRAQAAKHRGEAPNPYWLFHPGRAAASLVLGAGVVVAMALGVKLLVETVAGVSYTILWTRTVPLLALAMGWVIHGEWNRRILDAGSQQEPEGSTGQPEGS